MHDQRWIAKACCDYYTRHSRLPLSLAALVSDGLLPEKSAYYKEPRVLRYGFLYGKIHFTESCYIISATKHEDIEELCMIGKRLESGIIEYNPIINSELRDKLRFTSNRPPETTASRQ